MNNFNLQTMTQTELTGLRNEIDDVLLGLNANEAPDVVHFYDCLSKGLDFLVGKTLPPLSVLKEESPHLYEVLVNVTQFVNENTCSIYPDEDGKKEARQLYVRLVSDYMKMMRIPMTLRNFLMFDGIFPRLMNDTDECMYSVPETSPFG
jgi:hypothetical protein